MKLTQLTKLTDKVVKLGTNEVRFTRENAIGHGQQEQTKRATVQIKTEKQSAVRPVDDKADLSTEALSPIVTTADRWLENVERQNLMQLGAIEIDLFSGITLRIDSLGIDKSSADVTFKVNVENEKPVEIHFGIHEAAPVRGFVRMLFIALRDLRSD